MRSPRPIRANFRFDVRVAELLLERLGPAASGTVLVELPAAGARLGPRGVERAVRRLEERHWFRCKSDPADRSRWPHVGPPAR
jgi:hypothetical protein